MYCNVSSHNQIIIREGDTLRLTMSTQTSISNEKLLCKPQHKLLLQTLPRLLQELEKATYLEIFTE